MSMKYVAITKAQLMQRQHHCAELDFTLGASFRCPDAVRRQATDTWRIYTFHSKQSSVSRCEVLQLV